VDWRQRQRRGDLVHDLGMTVAASDNSSSDVVIIHTHLIPPQYSVHERAELYLCDDDRSARDPELEQLPKAVCNSIHLYATGIPLLS
jgi:hypothetical protein